jgi:hypothetical protein
VRRALALKSSSRTRLVALIAARSSFQTRHTHRATCWLYVTQSLANLMTRVSLHAIFSRSDYSYSGINRSKYVCAPVNRLVILELDVRKQTYSYSKPNCSHCGSNVNQLDDGSTHERFKSQLTDTDEIRHFSSQESLLHLKARSGYLYEQQLRSIYKIGTS